MQVKTQEFLRLCEDSGKLVFFDIEATGLRGDYNSILVISIKPYHQDPISFSVMQPGNDRRVVRQAADYLSSDKALIWCGYYSKGFDFPMITTRLLKWGLPPLEKKLHLDMYYMLKSKILTARRSQGHLLSWLGTENTKMGVGADVWNNVLEDPKKHMPTMIKRCESDCAGLEDLYDKTSHLILEVTR